MWVANLVVFPYELDYGEGIVLWQTQHVAHLASAYKPLTQYPYIVFHYPPLYHVVALAVSKLTGDLLFAGRLVSMLSGIGIGLVLAWIVYRSVPARAPRLGAISASVLAASLPCGLESMEWTPYMRVDMLGLLLTFGGLAVFILARSTAQRYGAFILLVAAMYTRQTLIAGALACLLVAAILDFRQAIKFAIFTAALGGAVLAALSFATHGEVIKHIFLYNRNRYSFRHAIKFLSETIGPTIPLLALAGAAAFRPIMGLARAFSRRAAAPLRARLSNNVYRLAVFTFTLHLLLSTLTSLAAGKRGSNVNYFLEWNLSACALAGLFVGRLLWSWRRGRLSRVGALAYLLPVLVLAQQTETPLAVLLHGDTGREELAERARHSQALLRILRNSPEPVMSEDMTLLYKAGKQIPFEPAIIAELVAMGLWDDAPLVEMVRNRAFSVMLIEDVDYRYSPELSEAIKDNYKPTEQYGDLTVYRPEGAPRSFH